MEPEEKAARDVEGSLVRSGGFVQWRSLKKGIGADRSTTERLLLSIGARKAEGAEEWTLNPL
jgi:hypothetical protein